MRCPTVSCLPGIFFGGYWLSYLNMHIEVEQNVTPDFIKLTESAGFHEIILVDPWSTGDARQHARLRLRLATLRMPLQQLLQRQRTCDWLGHLAGEEITVTLISCEESI